MTQNNIIELTIVFLSLTGSLLALVLFSRNRIGDRLAEQEKSRLKKQLADLESRLEQLENAAPKGGAATRRA